ncbi:SdpI family protein [Candidatus Micrarchaeota archaeon]|nr:SdpI family protein [Candidatus Micrarchaeota archaeon]
MKKYFAASIGVLILLFLGTIVVYSGLPADVVSHWNARGAADSSSQKPIVFLVPILAVGLFILFQVLPKIDPFKKNYKKFTGAFEQFVFVVMLFLSFLQVFTVGWNLGFKLNVGAVMAVAISALMYFVGNLVEKSERNWFIGFRTPWTISSDENWRKTNRLGGKLYKLGAVACLLSLLVVDYAIFIILGLLIAVSIYLFAYSYFEYRKSAK